MKNFVLVLLVAAVLQITSVNGFFGWWSRTNKWIKKEDPKPLQSASTAPDLVANLDDKTRAFQLENFGLTLQVGDEYEIRVHENPTTGYSWSLSEDSQSSFPGIISVEKEYIRDASEDGYVGVGGQAIYRIKAENEGEAFFEINHIRPWMPEEVIDHFKIPITVKP